MRANRHQSWEQRLDAGTIPVPEAGCLLWTGYVTSDGYGSIGVGGKPQRVHRLAYQRAFGPIPEGMQVCHRCDTPRCVEPSHLFLGSTADNMADKASKGRAAHGEGHGRCRLSDAQVAAIRADTRTQAAISAAFGVSSSRISQIKAGDRV